MITNSGLLTKAPTDKRLRGTAIAFVAGALISKILQTSEKHIFLKKQSKFEKGRLLISIVSGNGKLAQKGLK